MLVVAKQCNSNNSAGGSGSTNSNSTRLGVIAYWAVAATAAPLWCISYSYSNDSSCTC